jgi:hypothetical protein
MNKIGFHFYPDTDHYRRSDLKHWLPELESLQVSWLGLEAPLNRAVPEHFLTGLLQAGIQPVLHFRLPPDTVPRAADYELLFETYARWGVKYLKLFERPNLKSSWRVETWTQSELVERFLDAYLPLANTALSKGLRPIFPTLQPGGDYWDTMFLRASLVGLRRRASDYLLERLILSACADGQGRSLNWGVGGPERWPEAQPYQQAGVHQDHRGFRIADWYLALSEAILGKKVPVMMVELGGEVPDQEDFVGREMAALELLEGEELEGFEPLPEQVLCGMFRLVDDPGSSPTSLGWFHRDGNRKPVVDAALERFGEPARKGLEDFRMKQYLLLPTYEWGVADWHLEVTRSYIKRHRPTLGFSLQEAARAEHIVVLGGEEHFSEEALNELRAKGSVVRRVEGDGTDIAAQLAAI